LLPEIVIVIGSSFPVAFDRVISPRHHSAPLQRRRRDGGCRRCSRRQAELHCARQRRLVCDTAIGWSVVHSSFEGD
jgi:hypothetical protein